MKCMSNLFVKLFGLFALRRLIGSPFHSLQGCMLKCSVHNNWWGDFVGQWAEMRHWSVVILLVGTGKVDRSCSEVQSHAMLEMSALAPWNTSPDGQAASVVLAVLELCASVGQSDAQGEQLRSGLVAPWIASFEGVHRARHSHCRAAMLHRLEQALLLCFCSAGFVSCGCSASKKKCALLHKESTWLLMLSVSSSWAPMFLTTETGWISLSPTWIWVV